MERFVIQGGVPLRGEVTISGAKNAALAILPACIIADGVCTLENVPDIQDIKNVIEIMRSLGATIEWRGEGCLSVDASTVNGCDVSSSLARQMRGSYYFLGALLSRFGRASATLPGGCNIGARPIDQHVKMFTALGCDVEMKYDEVKIRAQQLIGSHIFFDKVTVGATINSLLAAVTAEGITELENVAKEPHVVDTANFLNKMGANIRGAGTDVIRIRPSEGFHPVDYAIVPDQIEAGTYMAAAVATGGEVLIKNVIPKHLETITARFRQAGATIEEYESSILVSCNKRLSAINIKTMPYPGFPTDMQPQFGALMATADGYSTITESIWDNRFKYTEQLSLMGANVRCDGDSAIFEGVPRLHGATVRSCDLRAGAAMVIAGLAAEGETRVEDIYHIERGYERLVEKLTALGARIEKTAGNLSGLLR